MAMERDALAIVGIDCIFPDALDVSTFWRNILNKHSSLKRIERSFIDPLVTPDGQILDEAVKELVGATMPKVDIKPRDFHILPNAAKNFDPRILPALEVVRRLLEEKNPQQPRDRMLTVLCCQKMFPREEPTGISWRRYQLKQLLSNLPFVKRFSRKDQELFLEEFLYYYKHSITEVPSEGLLSESGSIMASIIPKRFGTAGGHCSIDATCASALIGMRMAWGALQLGQNDSALIVAVGPMQSRFSYLTQLGVLTKRALLPLDESADGMALGEGVGAILVKRLTDAERDGDKIYAVVRGLGLSSDVGSAGFMAPRQAGQVQAIEAAYKEASLDPSELMMIEAHATGTPKGDETEIASLNQVFHNRTLKYGKLPLTAVKGNIGHLLPASSLAGIIKTCMALAEGIIPPSIYKRPRVELREPECPFELLGEARSFVKGRRLAAINSFGFGGVNAHIILEAHPSTARDLEAISQGVSVSMASSSPRPSSQGEVSMGAVASATTNGIAARVLEVIARCTGYDVAELKPEYDLDVDLGVDSIKHMEILLALGESFKMPASEDDQITNFPTIQSLVNLVQSRCDTPAPVAEAPVVVAAVAVSPVVANVSVPAPTVDLTAGVLEVIGRCTGYDVSELKLEYDLDVDLGVDSIKHMEILLALGESFKMPASEDDQITNFPTIQSLVNLVQSRCGTPAPAAEAPVVVAPVAPVTVAVSPVVANVSAPAPTVDLTAGVLEVIGRCTGYDVAELKLEYDLDVDLGVDSIKHMEILLALGESFKMPASEDDQITNFPTIQSLVNLVQSRCGTPAPVAQAPVVAPAASVAVNGAALVTAKVALAPTVDLTAGVLEVIGRCTGYDVSELKLEYDLDVDLGVDSIKHMEILLALGESFKMPASEDDQITNFPTIQSLVNLVQSRCGTPAPVVQAEIPTVVAPMAAPAEKPVALVNNGSAPIVDLTAGVLEVIGRCTGYDVSELKLEYDLDVDLGVDSIKHMEILLALGESFKMPASEDDQITNFPTIQSLVNLVQSRCGTPAPVVPVIPAVALSAPISPVVAPVAVAAAPAPKKAVDPQVAVALEQVKGAVAKSLNYEATWLQADIPLQTVLGMSGDDLKKLRQELGLFTNGRTPNGNPTLGDLALEMTGKAPEAKAAPEAPVAPVPVAVTAPPTVPDPAPKTALPNLVLGFVPVDPQLFQAQLPALAQQVAQVTDRPVVNVDLRSGDSPYRAFALIQSEAITPNGIQAALQAAHGTWEKSHGFSWGPEVSGTVQAPPLAFVTPGAGSLSASFYEELTALDPVVTEVRSEGERAFAEHVGQTISFLDLFNTQDTRATHPLYQRPATVTASVAMARLLEKFGIKPDLVAGHSVGELTACHLAGCFDHSQLIRLTTAPFVKGALAAGAMAALIGTESEILALVAQAAGRVVVSNRNSPKQLVVSGLAKDIDALVLAAKNNGIKAVKLEVATAYHSSFLEVPHSHYREALSTTTVKTAQIPVVSGLTSDILPFSENGQAQIRALLDCAFIGPVNHVGQVKRLRELGAEVLVDLGPTDRLVRMDQDILSGEAVVVLGVNPVKRSGRLGFLEGLAQLHLLGYPVRDPYPTPVVQIKLPEMTIQIPVLEITPEPISPGHVPKYLEPIAVIGIGAVLPEAANAPQFWQNILNKVDTHEEVSIDRWNPAYYYDADPKAPDKSYTTVGCFVKNLPFKPLDFRIPPKAAERMDKAQKMALLATKEALQDAGLLDKEFDRDRVQVIMGTSVGEDTFTTSPRLYFDMIAQAYRESPQFQKLSQDEQERVISEALAKVRSEVLETTEDTMSGMLPNIVAGRVANCFNLRGGNATVDAACASSLGALDYALKSLRMGETDLIVLGGAESGSGPFGYVTFCKTKALSVKGKSTPFDASADGFVMGEGAGVVLLKRLSDAERAGDKIYAVIRACGISSDGAGKGITAPNPLGQKLSTERAYLLSGINPATIGLVEAHGTSTKVGDATEVSSLTDIYKSHVSQPHQIALGSVKSMIGHLRAAAGIAGLIKSVFAVHHGILPPTINYQTPNPNIDPQGPFYVNTESKPWTTGSYPRRAAVNSFGFGGTNFHVILESYDQGFYQGDLYQQELMTSESYQKLGAGARSVAKTATEQAITDLGAAIQNLALPLVVTKDHQVLTGEPADFTQIKSIVSALRPEDLGAESFRRAHGVKYAYVSGAMASGIGSADIVITMAKAGMLGFFGAGGLGLNRVEENLQRITTELSAGQPFGVNLLHNPLEPQVEEQSVDLFLKYGVRFVSASAFLRLTSALIRYRLKGLKQSADGSIQTPHKVFAKISNPVVAEQFMKPAPQAVIDQLLSAGKITPEEARLGALVPVAEDITSEADSGGHTDGRPLSVLLPEILRLRDHLLAKYNYAQYGLTLRVGAAGGLGDPLSARAALAAGADYLLTGSINQSSIQAGTSQGVKEMLAKAQMTDMAFAPAGDMFEMGAQVQVLKRGNFFAQRGKYLYEVYKAHASLEALPAADREKIEKDIFRRPIDEIWAGTADYWAKRDPKQLDKANSDGKFKMALTFRWYMGMTSRWPLTGDLDRAKDYQIWCGPSMGSFNSWVKGTWLEDLANRHVDLIALAMLTSTAVLTRADQLRQCGVVVPSTTELAQPWARADLQALQGA